MLSKSNSLLGVGLSIKVLFCFMNDGRTAVYSKKEKCARTIRYLFMLGSMWCKEIAQKSNSKALLG